MTEKKQKSGSGSNSVSMRFEPNEKAILQHQAEALGINLSDLLKIRIATSAGITLYVQMLDERMSRHEKTAERIEKMAQRLDDIYERISDQKDMGEMLALVAKQIEHTSDIMRDTRATANETRTGIKALEASTQALERLLAILAKAKGGTATQSAPQAPLQ